MLVEAIPNPLSARYTGTPQLDWITYSWTHTMQLPAHPLGMCPELRHCSRAWVPKIVHHNQAAPNHHALLTLMSLTTMPCKQEPPLRNTQPTTVGTCKPMFA
jgi:hypothetical protein